FFASEFGNAASKSHAFGWRAEEAVTRARTQIARLLNADPKEIVFTSGATESNNLALVGAFEAAAGRGEDVITGATEHPAVLHGGGHERGLRPGTLNVPGIVGLAAALEIARAEMPLEARRLGALRDRLQEGILARVEDVQVNGHPTARLPHNLSLSFAYVEGEALLMALDDVAVSSGSACSSEKKEPSHVLRAMGLSDTQAQTSLRFGLGSFN